MPSAGAWSCWRGSAVRSLLVPAVWTWRLGHCLTGLCLAPAHRLQSLLPPIPACARAGARAALRLWCTSPNAYSPYAEMCTSMSVDDGGNPIVTAQSSHFWGAYFGVSSECLTLLRGHVRTAIFKLSYYTMQHADTMPQPVSPARPPAHYCR